MLAYFGCPEAHEVDAERATQAGLELVSAMTGFVAPDGTTLRVRVAIGTGLVVVGGIFDIPGSPEGGVVGETPNRAARLQAAAEPDTVVVDAGTHRRLVGLFECRNLGFIRVKGLPEPVQAWQVLRRTAVGSRSGALRPEFRPPWTGLPHVTALAIGGLGRCEAAALVARTAGDAALPAAVVEQIIDRTGGVPLFLEELTRAAVEADWHDASEPTSGVTRLPVCAVPAMLYGPLATRLDRLGNPAREVAQIGAVIGPEFTYELLAAVAHWPEAKLRSALDRLVDAGLVFRTGGDPPRATYWFKHALVRDTSYSPLLRARRRELHGSIARAIAGLFPETAAARPELLAQHYAQGGLIREAVDSWSEAGRQAIAASAMTEARAHLAHALALAAEMPPGPARQLYQAELQLTLGNVEMATHGFGSPEHGAAFAAAAELCRALPLTEPRRARLAARALYGDWSYKLGKGDFAANLLVGEDLLRLGRERDDRDLRLFTAHTYGSSCMFVGRLVEAWSVFTEALPANCGGGSESRTADFGLDAEAIFSAQFSRTLACMGFLEQAVFQARLSLTRARGLTHLPSRAVSLANVSTTLLDHPRCLFPTESVQRCRDALGRTRLRLLASTRQMLRGLGRSGGGRRRGRIAIARGGHIRTAGRRHPPVWSARSCDVVRCLRERWT